MTTTLPPTDTTVTDANARLQEMYQQSLEQQRAEGQASLYMNMGMRNAAKEAGAALDFLSAFVGTVNENIQASAQAKADGFVPAPETSGVDSGFIYAGDPENDKERWDNFGDIFNSGGG